MAETEWVKKWKLLKQIVKKEAPEPIKKEEGYYHYTSLPVLFSILEGDELWAANVRFSNDAMEERMLKLDNLSMRDDYIVCFCTENDKLSQWRGYCHNGGAAIKFYLAHPQKYSVLHSDFDKTGNYEVYENIPLPVVYLDSRGDTGAKRKAVENIISASGYEKEIALEDLLPYMKNGCFYEEKERRFVFSNINSNLSKCIRFRTLPDGVKVPYIVIRHGVAGKMKGNCMMDISEYDDEHIWELAERGDPIWIEEGFNQEAKYYEMMKRVEEFKKSRKPKYPIKVFCKGRLPIEKIMVAPTYDRERKAEQIKRFCMSKYWLNHVEVEISKIPYIQPTL